MSQLQLARLEPAIEGEVREGPLAGAIILRLAGGEMAMVLERLPTDEQWRSLFPRCDRVFVPHGEGQWLAIERLEGLVHGRMDLTL